MKKLLLGLGTLAAVAAPVATVIACGSTKEESTEQTKITQIASDTKVDQTEITKRASVIQPEDEGFDEGSLIENFDINKESQLLQDSYEFNYAGKNYDNFKDMFEVWSNDAKQLVKTSDTLHDIGVFGIETSFAGVNITITLLDGNGNVIPGETHTSEPKNYKWQLFAQTIGAGTFNPEYAGWEPKHHLEVRPTKKIEPLKHSIDSIIYSQAQSLTNTIDTLNDKVLIGSSTKELDVVKMTKNGFDDFQYSPDKTSFSTGDTLTFVFNSERDIKSFTKRVGYIDGVNNMFTSSTAENKVMKLGVLDGEIYSYEPKADAPDKTKAAFKLEAIAKNAVKLTFIKPTGNAGNDQGTKQFFLLNGFKDLNGDGVITAEDKGITNPFDYK